MNHVDAALQQFKSDDYTVRLCNAILGVLPFAPEMPSYVTLEGAAQALYPAGGGQVSRRADELASGEGATSALWVANAIDMGDQGIAVLSGLKSALGFFFGESKQDALETDPQQAIDAGLKLLGLAFMIHKLYPGSVREKVEAFHTTPAGQSLSLYYGAVEIGLPFADNVLSGGGGFVQRLMDRYGGDASAKLGSALGGDAARAAQGTLSELMGPIEGAASKVAPYARSVAEAARSHLPGFMGAADKVAGLVATGADALPVYRYLGARLAAESCVLIASRG
jgi:hypothetical protein